MNSEFPVMCFIELSCMASFSTIRALQGSGYNTSESVVFTLYSTVQFRTGDFLIYRLSLIVKQCHLNGI